MKLTVKNCLGSDFNTACEQLAQQVATGYLPDLLVGIRTGGARVAEAMLVSGVLKVNYAELLAQRRATRYKKAFKLEWILLFVPLFICNVLRVWEMNKAIAAFNPQKPVERDIILSEQDAQKLAAAKRVLIVDDAVDSGATLLAVCQHIRQLNPSAEIRTAALTVTFPQPVQAPDFTLYKGVLLRFPWAADAGRLF